MSPICHWVKKANQSKYKNSPCDWSDIKWSEWFLLQCEILSWWFRKSVVNVTEKAGLLSDKFKYEDYKSIECYLYHVHGMQNLQLHPFPHRLWFVRHTQNTDYLSSLHIWHTGEKITKVGLYYWQKSMLTCSLRPERNWHFADNISQHLIWIITCVMCMRCRFFFLF